MVSGFVGSITLLGEEPDLPYERPPLSKDYLAGEKSAESLLMRPAAYWSERDITIVPGEKIVDVDPHAHIAHAQSGKAFPYGTMVWATGGHARQLGCRGSHLAGLHAIRTRADVDALHAELNGVDRVAVIGGGYIGLESAAVLTKLGKSVTLVEA